MHASNNMEPACISWSRQHACMNIKVMCRIGSIVTRYITVLYEVPFKWILFPVGRRTLNGVKTTFTPKPHRSYVLLPRLLHDSEVLPLVALLSHATYT